MSWRALLKDLLCKLLEKDPRKRCTLKEAMNHKWVTDSYTLQLLHPSGISLREFKMTKKEKAAAMTPNIASVFANMSGTEIIFEKGAVIIKEGEASPGVFLVMVGTFNSSNVQIFANHSV